MANQKHLDILKQGIVAWNEWRKRNRYIKVDLSKANLSEVDLMHTDLREADLYGAYIMGGDLSRARLEGANLRWAELSGANFNNTNSLYDTATRAESYHFLTMQTSSA